MVESKLDTMYRMRQSGMGLEEIGGHFGITKQAVGKLLTKHYGSSEVHELLTTADLAQLTGYTPNYILKLKQRGVIEPVKTGQKNRYWKPETIATIIKYRDRNPLIYQICQIYGICRICYRPLPPGHSAFCSEARRIEGGKFRNRPLEVKQRHQEAMRRWGKAHPEQFREIRRRSNKKYMAKRRGLTKG